MRWYQKVKASASAALSAWQGKTFNFSSWSGRTFWGIDNSKLATNENIFSIVTRLANTLASLPLKQYKDYDVQYGTVAQMVMNEPNPVMTSFDFIRTMEVSRNENGNAYAIIQRDIRQIPIAMHPLETSAVDPFIDTETGELWYQIRGVGGTYYAHHMDIIHVKHIAGVNKLVGINPLDVLRNTLQFDKAVQEFALNEMEKLDSFILSYAANVDNEKRQQVVDNFRQFYDENGGVIFTEPGVSVSAVDKKYISADTINNEKITRDRVANVYNVPVAFLNEASGGFSNNEQMMIQFVQMSISPTVRQYEQEFNKKLLTPLDKSNGFYFKFNVGALLRGDTATRTNFYQSMIRCGVFKPNEIRMLEDMPPVESEMANQLLISGDLYPLDLSIEGRKGTATTTTVDEIKALLDRI